jgi:hypothetical protein
MPNGKNRLGWVDCPLNSSSTPERSLRVRSGEGRSSSYHLLHRILLFPFWSISDSFAWIVIYIDSSCSLCFSRVLHCSSNDAAVVSPSERVIQRLSSRRFPPAFFGLPPELFHFGVNQSSEPISLEYDIIVPCTVILMHIENKDCS